MKGGLGFLMSHDGRKGHVTRNAPILYSRSRCESGGDARAGHKAGDNPADLIMGSLDTDNSDVAGPMIAILQALRYVDSVKIFGEIIE
jgi:hypothetical protein